MNKNNSRFQAGSGVYNCIDCDMRTRETGAGESSEQRCLRCFLDYYAAGFANEWSDKCGKLFEQVLGATAHNWFADPPCDTVSEVQERDAGAASLLRQHKYKKGKTMNNDKNGLIDFSYKNRLIDFQCDGELVAAHRVREATADDPAKFAVLVYFPIRGDCMSWVVSYYTNGATDWDQGSYFDKQEEALECLAQKALDAVRFPL